ncbi:hypothetical protein [Cyanobium sp. Morenito 9A2]|uniref:hypothetical protein n=1 Tax=Cyanobium sp. Morenito 9A2 TaxID=2823718 RepID=UPI0020CC94D1|nr:hypothetical protein [Cyanobium sp. Morenito 9A2]MCP9850807.1 hypothetical protein [Cyanobium sp. Morenito 9A2]
MQKRDNAVFYPVVGAEVPTDHSPCCSPAASSAAAASPSPPKARLAGFDASLELAAQDQAPPPLAAILLSLSPCCDDGVISRFTVAETVSLPLSIELAGAFQWEISPQIQLLSSLVLSVGAVARLLASSPRFNTPTESIRLGWCVLR